jgi:glycosyltransferase involved in cell wall biosynthesis
MNILHLNTYTFKHNLSFPHYQFHKELLKEGNNSIILSAKGDVIEKEIILLDKLRKTPYFGISRIARKLWFEILKKNDFNYFYPEWNLDFITKNQVVKSLPFKPDIIITYWTKFAFNQKLIYKLSEYFKVPVLCFMMDMAPMTGGCHYAFDCTNYQNTCGECPALNSINEKDLSYINWKFKKKYIDNTNISLIAASSTLANQASRSSLFKGKKIEKLMLSVDENIFKPENKEKAQEYFNIPKGKKVIFFGAASLTEKRKGFKYLIEALNIMSKNINNTNLKNENIFLLIAGNKLPKVDIPYEYMHVGYLKTQNELALAYQASDLFVCSSIEDSGPLMITQAIMSGRPVVCFDMGVAPDLVHTGYTGFRARLKDSKDLACGIELILCMSDEDWQLVSNNCRKLGLSSCSLSTQSLRLNKIINAAIMEFKGD